MTDCKGFCTLIAISFWLFSSEALAIVDMKSANYAESWDDVVIGGSSTLRVHRTYNSRSLYDGILGFGWCSDFETKIEVISPAEIMLTHCGGGMEEQYSLRNYDLSVAREKVRSKILNKIRERRPDLSADYLAELENDFRSN